MAPVLEVKDLSFAFEERQIFHGLNLTLDPGESYAVLGASGSGKSVLLKLLCGLYQPAQGTVAVLGTDLARASAEALAAVRTKIGMVFQDAALISNMSIYDNVALPLRYHTRLSPAEVDGRVAEKLALFEVDRKYDRFIPAQVSLGVRKRTALARAIILDPEILFLDEPAAGLGEEADRLLGSVLRGYQEQAQAALVVATGDWPTAFGIADCIGLLEEGRIAGEAPPLEMEARLKKLKRGGMQPA